MPEGCSLWAREDGLLGRTFRLSGQWLWENTQRSIPGIWLGDLQLSFPHTASPGLDWAGNMLISVSMFCWKQRWVQRDGGRGGKLESFTGHFLDQYINVPQSLHGTSEGADRTLHSHADFRPRYALGVVAHVHSIWGFLPS